MKARQYLTGFLVLVAGLAVWAAVAQKTRLQELRRERNTLLSELSGEASVAAGNTAQPPGPPASGPAEGTSPELLQLRNEVARLSARKQQLAGVPAQNRQLRQAVVAQSSGTNTGLAAPGFVRKSQARFAGFNSPQDTLQSYLWAIQNRDVTNMLQALSPAATQEVQGEFARSDKAREEFFEQMQAFVGFRVLEEKRSTDGSIKLKVEILPELPPGEIGFHLVNGQWRMDLPR